jgi:ribosomal protein L19
LITPTLPPAPEHTTHRHGANTYRETAKPRQPAKEIPTFQPPPSARKTCSDAIAAVTSSQLALLDPTGARTRLFSKKNPEAARVGDVLLVRLRNGDPFAGVCLKIRRRGIDTGVLLRGQLTRVGVEMWYKVYSPNVEGIEVVQRREKRVRRARLYYMRWVVFLNWRVKKQRELRLGRAWGRGRMRWGFVSGFWDFLLITLAGNLSMIWDRSRISCGSINARGLC